MPCHLLCLGRPRFDHDFSPSEFLHFDHRSDVLHARLSLFVIRCHAYLSYGRDYSGSTQISHGSVWRSVQECWVLDPGAQPVCWKLVLILGLKLSAHDCLHGSAALSVVWSADFAAPCSAIVAAVHVIVAAVDVIVAAVDLIVAAVDLIAVSAAVASAVMGSPAHCQSVCVRDV
jgi:hypothetical protein